MRNITSADRQRAVKTLERNKTKKHFKVYASAKIQNDDLYPSVIPYDNLPTPVLIPHSGMENVPLKKMWLQSCCLAARATETRDQGETCLLKQRCGLVLDCKRQ